RRRLGEAGDELGARADRLDHRVGREGRGHVDHRGVRARLPHRLLDRVEHRHGVVELLPALPRSHPRHHAGSVLAHLARVERSIAPCNPLYDEARILIDEDAHLPSPLARFTDHSTASSMSVIALNPAAARISAAFSSLVPVSRITIGTAMSICRVAVTMPLATSSQRVIPPKMLKRMTRTLGSEVMMRRALTTFSGFDDPPMSRKLAGSPP